MIDHLPEPTVFQLVPEDVNVVYLALFFVYLLVILLIGLWGYLQAEGIDDFWVYGKELGPTLATWSFVATFVSSVSVIGFIGDIYLGGYQIMTGIIFGLMLGMSAFYFAAPFVRKLDLLTFSDIMAEVSGIEASKPVTGVILLLEAWLYIIMQLLGAALLVTAITGVPFEYMVWVIGVVFIVYTAAGGLISVAWTDLVQGTLMVAAVFIALFYMIYDIGSLTAINQQFAEIDPAFVDPIGDQTLVFLLATQFSFFGTIFTIQSIIIRTNATVDVRTAKLHVAWSGVILSVFYVALVFLGGATTVAITETGIADEMAEPDLAFPLLITEYVPTVIGTVIIIAVMSAILSTTDQSLHAAGVTTANDIYAYFADDPSEDQLFTVSRTATVVAGVLAILVTMDPPGTIIFIYEFRAVLLTSALFVPVYAALWKRDLFSGVALVTSVTVGGVVGIGWQLLQDPLGVPAVFAGTGLAILVLAIGATVDQH